MKKLLLFILLTIINIVCVYSCFAFIHIEFDFRLWSQIDRSFFVLLSLCVEAFVPAVTCYLTEN